MIRKKTFVLTIIIPTFNEVDNLLPLIKKIDQTLAGINFQILFVDDNSSDGTSERIIEQKSIRENVDLILRLGRRGLAGACIEGIIAANSEFVAVMDCDLQHDEKILPQMLKKFEIIKNLDLVVGSRHVNDGKAEKGFSLYRRIGSEIAIKFTQIFLKISVSDPMSGFFMVKKSSVMKIIKNLQPSGFKILADIIATSNGNWKIVEIGYEFKKRHSGKSKMNFSIALELIALIASHLTFGFLSTRFFLFGFVGLTGVFVQLFSTFLLMSLIGLPFLISHTISILIAMTSNFSFNNLLTYKDRSLSGKNYIKGLFSFYFICALGALVNISIGNLIFEKTGLWTLASLLGAMVGAVWNFVFNSIFTWKIR